MPDGLDGDEEAVEEQRGDGGEGELGAVTASSPTRWATTSAWCTAARTAPARQSATTSTANGGSSRPQLNTSASAATSGTTTVHRVASARIVALVFVGRTLPEPAGDPLGGRTRRGGFYACPSQYGSRNRRLYSLPLGSRGIVVMNPRVLGRL